MNVDSIWRAFADTGDPVYYLLYKAAEEQKLRPKNKEQAGKTPVSMTQTGNPRPED